MKQGTRGLSRRKFAATAAASGIVSHTLFAQESPPIAPEPLRPTVLPVNPPFGDTIVFTRKDVQARVQPFPMAQVRLLSGPFQEAQEWNLGYLHRLPADRLLHTFRLNAGLPSSAEPLGGWEKPDCEVRGHFTGHYLSACGLMYSST